MHKTVSVGSHELIVKSLADEGTSVVTADTYLGKEVLSIPGIGGWIRGVLNYKWIVIVIAGLLVVAGCIPRKAQKEETQKAAAQST